MTNSYEDTLQLLRTGPVHGLYLLSGDKLIFWLASTKSHETVLRELDWASRNDIIRFAVRRPFRKLKDFYVDIVPDEDIHAQEHLISRYKRFRPALVAYHDDDLLFLMMADIEAEIIQRALFLFV